MINESLSPNACRSLDSKLKVAVEVMIFFLVQSEMTLKKKNKVRLFSVL